MNLLLKIIWSFEYYKSIGYWSLIANKKQVLYLFVINVIKALFLTEGSEKHCYSYKKTYHKIWTLIDQEIIKPIALSIRSQQ